MRFLKGLWQSYLVWRRADDRSMPATPKRVSKIDGCQDEITTTVLMARTNQGEFN